MPILLTALALFAITSAGEQQPLSQSKPELQYQYGSSKELKGIAKIYVDTGTDLELHDQIVRIVQSELKERITVTETPEEAEVILMFEGGVRALEGIWKERWGNGSVVRFVNDHTVRLLMTYKRPKEAYRVGHHPADDFAETFVQGFREANNLDRHNHLKRQ